MRREVAGKRRGAVDGHRSGAEQFASRRGEPDKVRAIGEPDLQSLGYLVFDRKKLVAAFAMHDDAEQWIGEFGNQRMKLLENDRARPPVEPKWRRANTAREKTGAMAARKR